MSDDDLTLSGYSSREPSRQPERWERPRVVEADYERWRENYDHDRQARRARKPRPVLTLFLAGLVIFCIAFAAAPLFAFRAVRSAAQFGDTQALSESVDFDAVRQSLRVQVRPASVERAPPTSIFRDPLAAIRRAWEPVSTQADVNPYLSAAALASLTTGRGSTGVAPAPPSGGLGGLFGGPIPKVRYWGFERARLGVADPTHLNRETIFTFQRRSLFGWRLVGVRLPQDSPGVPVSAPTPAAP
jgi:hypothetical protein